MSLDLKRFGTIRPCLFHLTARDNVSAIRASGIIECTSTLFRRGRFDELLRVRRDSTQTIEIDSQMILIRDQKPLHAGAIAFEPGWDVPRFVQHVNEHVFFWPGSFTGPINAGMNHYQRYAHEEPALIRVRWCSLLNANPDSEPLFSKFNSGAPRVVKGRRRTSRRDREARQGRLSFLENF